jgi:hypothetical protein
MTVRTKYNSLEDPLPHLKTHLETIKCSNCNSIFSCDIEDLSIKQSERMDMRMESYTVETLCIQCPVCDADVLIPESLWRDHVKQIELIIRSKANGSHDGNSK